MRITKSRYVVVVLALMLIMAACSDSDDGSDTTAVDTTAGSDTTAADDATTTTEEMTDDEPMAGEADPNATLVYVQAPLPESLDPGQTVTGAHLPALMLAYDRLVHQDPTTGLLTPGLATWEYSDDGQVLTLTLQEGVTFQDGTPLNAEAVAANFEAMASEDSLGAIQSIVSAIDSVDVVDEYTVALTRDPATEHDLNWALMLSKLTETVGMMVSPAALGNPDLDRNPVGAGPYSVSSIAPDEIVYERYDDHWENAAGAATLVAKAPLDQDVLLASLASGEVHLGRIEPRQIEDAEAAGLNVDVVSGNEVFHFHINWDRLDDELFRQAIVRGIDREALAETLTLGTGLPTPQVVHPDHPGYNPDYGIEQYPYDPELSCELVSQSSYADDPTFELWVPNIPFTVQTAEAIQGMLSEACINAELTVMEPLPGYTQWLEGGFDAWLGFRFRFDILDVLYAAMGANGDTNPSGAISDEVEALFTEAASLDPTSDRRNEIIQELSAIGVGGGYYTNLYMRPGVWASNPCVVGFQAPVTVYTEFRGVGIDTACLEAS